MEHPEKKLFDEVRALKQDIETIKERVFKLEANYTEQVEDVEDHFVQNSNSSKKILEVLHEQSNFLKIKTNNSVFPISRKTLVENMFISDKLISMENKALDIDVSYLLGMIAILRHGNNIYNNKLKQEDNVNVLEDNLKNDQVFHHFLERFFDLKNMILIAESLDLTYKFIPENIKVVKFTVEKLPYISNNIDLENFRMQDANDFNLKSSNKALFINKGGSILIELSESIRTDRITLRAYTGNNSLFNSANGWGTCQVTVSTDCCIWSGVSKLPTNNPADKKGVEIYLEKLNSFKYIRFYSPDAMFSIGYIGFN